MLQLFYFILLVDAPRFNLGAGNGVLQRFGPENSRFLFMDLVPGKNPVYPDGQKDNTHFTYFGARLIAQIVLAEIMTLNLKLTEE